MSVRRSVLTGLLCALTFLCLQLQPQPAAAVPTVGVGDNNFPMFDDPNYLSLGTKISRRILAYDFYKYPDQLENVTAWINGARAHGIEPLLAFQHSEVTPRKLPSVAEFRQTIIYVRTNFPDVRTISPWNEANHVTQPTWKNPRRAAEYFNATKALCRGCRIVAADVLDQKNMLPWIKAFQKTAKNPRIWGLHSYADSNKKVSWNKSATRRLLASVRGKVWLTEVGGIVSFKNNFAFNEARAATATRKVLDMSLKDRRIERVYIYCWFGTTTASMARPYPWDSGLVAPGGAPRPAFQVLKDWLSRH